MTGLDLESFLRLLQADVASWAVLGLACVGIALLVWSGWGSRRALRKCLILSLAAHLGFVLYGSTVPAVLWAVSPGKRDSSREEHLRRIRVDRIAESLGARGIEPAATSARLKLASADQVKSSALRWDFLPAERTPADASLRVDRPEVATPNQERPDFSREFPEPAAVATAVPAAPVELPAATPLEPRSQAAATEAGTIPVPPTAPLAPDLAEIDRVDGSEAADPAAGGEPKVVEGRGEASVARGIVLQSDRRLRVERPDTKDSPVRAPAPTSSRPRAPRAAVGDGGGAVSPAAARAERTVNPLEPPAGAAAKLEDLVPLARATPRTGASGRAGSGIGLAALGERAGTQSLIEIPKIYQPRLVPDRSAQAQRIGATKASELAVERALDWLARHQDANGCWNAGIARYDDGSAVQGDRSFTAHCPAGDTCKGDCIYWEADTAVTGLALLTFLGAGYTHADGRYAEVAEKGLSYLIDQQKSDGDLRGKSRVVGIYCHAMATLALCEAYALTGDERLRDPSERAVAFLVAARARDGKAWRYAPGAPTGDTSILGWVVMCLKSAKEVGIPIPDEPSVRQGALLWLKQVSSGESKGLARYQPSEPVTPTMTAEAWVCRQFLGVGGPGPASTEAAEFLVNHHSDKGATNVYYWYYATLALYQNGGPLWTRWNDRTRDRIVALQRVTGHQTGSWDPDESLYGAKGGRIYCTALAALSLEVYYRYLRLYEQPTIPLGAGRMTQPSPSDPPSPHRGEGARRAGEGERR
jgi:hypothetical protein